MCTRLVYSGENMITGFNFDIDLAVWNHRVLMDENRFYIGIMRPDGTITVIMASIVTEMSERFYTCMVTRRRLFGITRCI